MFVLSIGCIGTSCSLTIAFERSTIGRMLGIIVRRWAWWSFCLLVITRPLIASLAFPATEAAWETAWTICTALCLWSTRSRQLPLTRPWLLPLIVWLGVIAVAAIRSPDHTESVRLAHIMVNATLGFLIAARSSIREQIQLRHTFLIGLLVISAYGLWQAAFGFPATMRYLQTNAPEYAFGRSYLETGRIFATFISPDLFSGFLIIIGVAVALPANRYRSMPAQTLRIVTVLLAIACLVLARSLGAWLSLIATVVLLTQLPIPRIKEHGSFWQCCSIPLALLGVLLLFVIDSRWSVLSDLSHPHNPIAQRWRYWQSAITMWQANPIIGVGLGGFGTLYGAYRLPDASDTLYAHNSYLQLAAETGLMGVATLAWFLAAAIRRGVQRCRLPRASAGWALPAAIAFLLHNLVSFDWYMPEVAIFGWLLLGLSVSLPRTQTPTPRLKEAKRPSTIGC